MVLILATLATFVIIAAIVLSGYYAVTAESPVERRLRQLTPEPPIGRSAGRAAPAPGSGFVKRMLAGLGQYGLGGAEDSLTRTLSVAGIRGTNATMLFVGTRTVVSVGPALLVLVQQVSIGRPLLRAVFVSALVWAFGHVLVNALLKRRARLRALKIADAMPDCLDLMVVCLEAGLSLNATIARVGEERASMDDPLGREFAQVALELREGRSREEALRALGDRNGVDDLKALVALIIQSDRLGASMGKTLRAHADVLRTKRRQRAEEAARKLPIKMLFPLAFFILPALFIATVGPALLILKNFFATFNQR